MPKHRYWFVALLLGVALTGALTQETVTLKLRMKPNDRSRVRLTITHYLTPTNSSGTTRHFVTITTYAQRVLKVAPDGTFTGEQSIVSHEARLDSRALPVPADYLKGKVTVVVKPTGEPVRYQLSVKEERSFEPDREHIGQSILVFFSRQPIAVGGKWRYRLREDPRTGLTPADYEYTLRRLETWRGRRVARVEIVYTARGRSQVKARGEALIDLNTGRTVYARARVQGLNLPFTERFRVTSADVLLERLQ